MEPFRISIAGQHRVVIGHDSYDFTEHMLKAAFLSAQPSLPVFRRLEFSVRAELEHVFDEFALNTGWRALRFSEGNLVLKAEGLFIVATGDQKRTHSSCAFQLWADSVPRVEGAIATIYASCKKSRITDTMFSLGWNHIDCDSIEQDMLQEIADDVLHDEAYPELRQGVQAFIAAYLAASEAVLVLQGNPGNGKTRLIRSILGEMSRRKGTAIKAIYTTDVEVLDRDTIFRRFINGLFEAFVVEDADHLLRPRSDGNDRLHRFLGISDGIIQAHGRKIIFSTNLPNLGDIDDALIRPGRCFARVKVRELSPAEAEKLLIKLSRGDGLKVSQVMSALGQCNRKAYSLKSIGRMATGWPTCRSSEKNWRLLRSGQSEVKRPTENSRPYRFFIASRAVRPGVRTAIGTLPGLRGALPSGCRPTGSLYRARPGLASA